MTDIPIIFECQIADSWRHKFDLWRHRADTVSFMSTIHPKYSTEMHQSTTFYAELNGEHAGEGFMPLRSILLEIWTRETKKSRNFRKFDLWPVITGSNIDLGPKIIPPIASTRRTQSTGLFREALRRFVSKRQGGVAPTPPLHRRRWRNAVYGRGLTRAPLGGGLFRAPPLVFLRYLLNSYRYHRQTCSTLSPNIFTHCVKILKSRLS